ncbi:MAG TPA: tRNA (guanosine(37)-N1)-methyltransferase TrmD [Candidatus Moranbacteria bacterium]|nr:MAG: tRNA (guanine-N(1)-)-methyltransferase [Candidatus Moranbacteria bacterium GW2011_GWC2_45_10]KKT95024.1 MAG: tRNA (guanine-N(1)-)-methyltransferase, tRNA (guanine-N1-)-methyltransferase [Parcubacteria group bacterium GW2011_GWC1_45_14]HAV11525.1 tRNA (guanosine(37)-N1)-methyltransferase TrmD [Candidatus Moranbacteria bacterium]
MKKFDIITIFPDIFDSYFNESIIKRAKEGGFIEIQTHNLRDYSTNKHRNVDDTPYGGGAGMVMQVEPIWRAVWDIKEECHPELDSGSQLAGKEIPDQVRNDSGKTRTILFSAKGKRFTQADAKRLSEYDRLIMVCGRYEGVDERVAENIVDEELSIGDYVLTGGEIPAMIVVDSVARLIPGVLGNVDSATVESHSEEGYLEYPQYTKPEDFQGWEVPKVLLSGNHAEIEKWRKEKSKKH